MEDRGSRVRRGRGSWRVVRPKLEALEMRGLLSAVPVVVQSTHANPAAVMSAALTGSAASAEARSQGLNPTGAITPLIGTGPNRRELNRERFYAAFAGPVYVGPGRFSDQAKTLFFRGLGTSNKFLHGDYQMAIVFPKDPAAPLFGEAILQDKNTNSQAIVAFPLKGVTPQTFDRLGRPTRFTFTSDPNIYSGIFFANTSQGTVNIHYSKGSAKVVFTGLNYNSGLANPLGNSDLYSRGGRITPRSGRA